MNYTKIVLWEKSSERKDPFYSGNFKRDNHNKIH